MQDGTLAASHPGLTVQSEAQAKAKVEELRQKLAAGADFAELARLSSDDRPSATKGGELDAMNRNSPYPKALKDAVSRSRQGQSANPFANQLVFIFSSWSHCRGSRLRKSNLLSFPNSSKVISTNGCGT